MRPLKLITLCLTWISVCGFSSPAFSYDGAKLAEILEWLSKIPALKTSDALRYLFLEETAIGRELRALVPKGTHWDRSFASRFEYFHKELSVHGHEHSAAIDAWSQIRARAERIEAIIAQERKLHGIPENSPLSPGEQQFIRTLSNPKIPKLRLRLNEDLRLFYGNRLYDYNPDQFVVWRDSFLSNKSFLPQKLLDQGKVGSSKTSTYRRLRNEFINVHVPRLEAKLPEFMAKPWGSVKKFSQCSQTNPDFNLSRDRTNYARTEIGTGLAVTVGTKVGVAVYSTLGQTQMSELELMKFFKETYGHFHFVDFTVDIGSSIFQNWLNVKAVNKLRDFVELKFIKLAFGFGPLRAAVDGGIFVVTDTATKKTNLDRNGLSLEEATKERVFFNAAWNAPTALGPLLLKYLTTNIQCAYNQNNLSKAITAGMVLFYKVGSSSYYFVLRQRQLKALQGS